MNINFLLILFVATAFCFTVWFSHRLLSPSTEERPFIVEQCRSLWPVLFAVFLIRSFLIQPYQVPTGSLLPTVLPGDFIVANQYQYGTFLPIWHKKLFSLGHARRGQIILFHDPVNTDVLLVKRLIGLPGDRISYVNKTLYVNGVKQKQTVVGPTVDIDSDTDVIEKTENFNNKTHGIFINPRRRDVDFYDVIVPAKHYFVMGDNRDNSNDSRYWGFVPEDHVVGQGVMVFFSVNKLADGFRGWIRWSRSGTRI